MTFITGQVPNHEPGLEGGRASGSAGANTETEPVTQPTVPGTWGPKRGQKTMREPLTEQDSWAFSVFEKTGQNQVMLH